MSCNTIDLYPGNSIKFTETISNPDVGPVNDATVTIDIKDGAGVSISEMPSGLDYETASDGVYSKTFQSLTVTPGDSYSVIITATTPDPFEYKSTCKAREKERKDCT